MDMLFPMMLEEAKKMPYYVTSVGTQKKQGHICRKKGFGYFHWLHSTKGEGMLIIENKEYLIKEGMGFFYYPGIPHEYFPVKEPWSSKWLGFDGNQVAGLLGILEISQFEVFYLKNMNLFNTLLEDIYNALNSKNPDYYYKGSALLYHFMIAMKTWTSKSDSHRATDAIQKLQPVVEYISHKVDQDISLEQMADIIGITPSYLCKLFKKAYNMTPFTFINHQRVRMAKEYIIQNPHAKINDISFHAGYNDTSYFCSVFKKFTGYSPAIFRKNYLGK